MIKLTDRIFAETSYTGCNIGWISTDEGIVLIDTPALPADIADLNKKINVNDIAYTVFTHEHFDHVLGGAEFGKRIIAHRNVIPEIERLKTSLPQDVNSFFPDLYRQHKNYFDNVQLSFPRITFNDALVLNLGSTEIQLFHVGGHSAASIFVYLPRDKVLFCGDNINIGMPYPTPVSRFDEWIRLLEKTEKMDINKMVPGHGGICGKEQAHELRVYFEGLRKQVTAMIQQGKTKDEVIRNLNIGGYLPVKMDESLKPQVTYHTNMMYEQVNQGYFNDKAE
jgi:cyclase